MTREEILNMPAGREMDALIAKEVMGWVLNPPNVRGHGWLIHDHKMIGINSLPYFSTDIAAVWLVVEKITDPHQMTQEMMHNMVNTKFGYWWDQANLWAMTALEAAEAICRAALLARMVDNGTLEGK